MTELRRRLSKYSVVSLAFLTVAFSSDSRAQEAIKLEVDWAAANSDFREVLSKDTEDVIRFRSAASAEFSETNLPVLLPVFGQERSAGGFNSFGDTYSSFYTLAGVQVSIVGTLNAFLIDDGAMVFEEAVRVSPSQDGIEGNFLRYGASYHVRITCDNLDDERCTSEDFIRSAIEGLEPLGGKEIVE